MLIAHYIPCVCNICYRLINFRVLYVSIKEFKVVTFFQLVDGHSLFDYNVGLNEIVQILIQKPPATKVVSEPPDEDMKEDVALPDEGIITGDSDVSVSSEILK